MIEVPFEAVTKQRGNADGNVAIAGKVAIDLYGVGIDRERQVRAGINRRVKENLINEAGRQIVGDDHLLEQANDDEKDAEAYQTAAQARFGLQLRQEIRRAHNRTGHELGKE